MPNQKQLNWIIVAYAIITFCSLVHPFHVHPLRNFYHDLLSVTALVVGIGLFAMLARIDVSVPEAVLLPMVLLTIVSLQLASGMLLQPADGLFPVVDLICLALAMVFGATLAATPEGFQRFGVVMAWMWIAYGLVSVLFQHVQLVNLDAWPWIMPAPDRTGLRPYGNLAQPNLMALHLCFALLSAWFLYVTNRLQARTATVIALLLLWGMTLAQSRNMWTTLPVIAFGCAFAMPGYRQVSKAALAGFLAAFVGMVLVAPHITALLGVPIDSVVARAGQTSERVVLWKEALAMSLDHPLFGVGWLQFGVHQVATAGQFPPSGVADYAHNIVLNFAAELGWPATLVILAGAGWWFKTNCLDRWREPQVRLLGLVIVALILHSMVEFPLWNTYVLVPFGVVVGVLQRRDRGIHPAQMGRLPVLASVLCMALAMGFVTWDFGRVVDGYRKLLREASVADPTQLQPYMPSFTVFPQFFDYLNVNKVRIYAGMPTADIEFLERMTLSFGFPPLLERLALAYALNHRPAEAARVLTAEQRLHIHYYPFTYATWKEYEQHDPALFGDILRHIPVPDQAGFAPRQVRMPAEPASKE